jgi:hypothetical protein
MQPCKVPFIVVTVALTLVACGGNSEQGREEAAAREFRQRLAQNRSDLIYKEASASLRQKMSEAEFRKLLYAPQALGIPTQAERAHYNRTSMPGESDIVVTFYNSRFTKGACLESFSWRMEADGLKLATYSCAPNMQVTCTGGSSCVTSPVPPPGFAG